MPPTDVFTYTLTSNQTWEQTLAYLKSQLNPAKLKIGRSYIEAGSVGFILQSNSYMFIATVYDGVAFFVEAINLSSRSMHYWQVASPSSISYVDQTNNVIAAGYTFKIYY